MDLPQSTAQRLETRRRRKVRAVQGDRIEWQLGQQLFFGKREGGREFQRLRYTPVLSRQPISFHEDGYRLRCHELGRKIKILVVITMYNEEASELERTLIGVAQNMATLMAAEGEDAWKKVAVVVVSDGRVKANAETLEYAEFLGIFDGKMLAAGMEEHEEDVRMHLFESTMQMNEDENFETSYPPIQTIFALKEHNGGKLDSHLWFFNAFAEQLQPKYCFLLDVGTQPRPRAMYKLYLAMETNPSIAGVCGEIATLRPDMLNPVVAAQHFEYKVSHFLDKALESTFGFVSVLPGAFSAYRYRAISEVDGKGPLVEYFKSITTPMEDLGAFKANMYLAEDRILCFELIAREGCDWTLHYVKNAVAETDVPEELTSLIKQRRRWLNGSFFATLYALLNFNRFWKDSTHSLVRKVGISCLFCYSALNLLLSWFLVSNFWVAFYFLVSSSAMFEGIEGVGAMLNLVYLFNVVVQLIIALGNKPDEMANIYAFSSTFFGLFAYLTFYLTTVYVIEQDLTFLGLPSALIKAASVFSIGGYFFAAALHGELAQVVVCFAQYMFLLPTFINVFTIYSFANMHDISWGTKGITEDKSKPKQPMSAAAAAALAAAKALEKLEREGGEEPGADDADLAGDHDPKQREANQRQVALELEQQEIARKKHAAQRARVDAEFRAFRSALLIIWVATNCIFAYLVAGTVVSQDVYLPFLFVVAFFYLGSRMLGSISFLLHKWGWSFELAVMEAGGLHGDDSTQRVELDIEGWRPPTTYGRCATCDCNIPSNTYFCDNCGAERDLAPFVPASHAQIATVVKIFYVSKMTVLFTLDVLFVVGVVLANGTFFGAYNTGNWWWTICTLVVMFAPIALVLYSAATDFAPPGIERLSWFLFVYDVGLMFLEQAGVQTAFYLLNDNMDSLVARCERVDLDYIVAIQLSVIIVKFGWKLLHTVDALKLTVVNLEASHFTMAQTKQMLFQWHGLHIPLTALRSDFDTGSQVPRIRYGGFRARDSVRRVYAPLLTHAFIFAVMVILNMVQITLLYNTYVDTEDKMSAVGYTTACVGVLGADDDA